MEEVFGTVIVLSVIYSGLKSGYKGVGVKQTSVKKVKYLRSTSGDTKMTER